MAEISNRHVRADSELEITAAGTQYKAAGNRWSPDDVPVVDDMLEMFENRIALIARFDGPRIFAGSKQDGVGPIDADQTQLRQRLRDSSGIVADVIGQSPHGVTGAFA